MVQFGVAYVGVSMTKHPTASGSVRGAISDSESSSTLSPQSKRRWKPPQIILATLALTENSSSILNDAPAPFSLS